MIKKDKLFPFCYFGACILMVLGILFNDVISWIALGVLGVGVAAQFTDWFD
jgi:hypothetical protein